jgi:AraC-like DNA-binding protein
MISAESSVMGPVSRCGQQLRRLAERYLSRMNDVSGFFSTEMIGQKVEFSEIDLTDETPSQINDLDETFVEMARNVIEEMALADFQASAVSSGQRRELALKVEQMLWEPPFLHDEQFTATLDEFAVLLNVSTRTIQIAIQEQFGIGFVALRRLIRLTQLRRAILESKGNATLSTLASDYKLHFGRLAQEYGQLFGRKPSQEIRDLRKAQSGP